jgi:hypothetical protein
MATLIVAAYALAVDVSWLYRFAVTSDGGPWGCHGLISPWRRLCDWLGGGRPYPPSQLLMWYEWRELVTLAGFSPLLGAIFFVTVRALGAFRWRFRLRTALLVVALAALEWTAVRDSWRTVEIWELDQMRSGSIYSLDTWIWGVD